MSPEDLSTQGFEGFVPVHHLRVTRLAEVPGLPGVYVFLRPTQDPPEFKPTSQAGHRGSRNPSVPVEVLQRRWVPATSVVYIGKAGGPHNRSTLRRRLQQYLDAGCGKPGHWGGRYIWQLGEAEELVVCWRLTVGDNPEVIESAMLVQFECEHGCLPFANLKRGGSHGLLAP